MAVIVGIVNRRGLAIEVHYRTQYNKSKLVLFKPWIHFNSHLNQLYIGNKTERFSYKGGCGICGLVLSKTFKRRASLRER